MSVNFIRKILSIKKIVDEWLNLTNRKDSREDDKDILQNFDFPLVYKMYAKHFVKPSKKFKQQLQQYKNFISSLWGVNRLLMPSAHFSQHGDYENHLMFGKILAQTAKQKYLQGYAQDFDSKQQLIDMIISLYSDDYVETEPKQGKNNCLETFFKYKGVTIAVWREEKDYQYGYLITEKGH